MRVLAPALVASLWLTQAPATGSASIQGRVVELASARAIPHAQVVAAKVGGPIEHYRATTTDDSGRFAFRDLVSGTYRLYAVHDEFLRAEYGLHAASTAGTPVTLVDSQTAEIVVTMTPTGVIAGHVYEDGKPARHIYVRALRPRFVDGERLLGTQEWTETNDAGEYRLFGLPPGRYLVSAAIKPRPYINGDQLVTPVIASNANNNRRQIDTPLSADDLPAAALNRDVYLTSYYDGPTDPASARSIDVPAGATLNSIDLNVAPTPTFRVTGRVAVASAIQPTAITVSAVRLEAANQGRSQGVSSGQVANGVFTLSNVPPGSYFLSAQTPTGAGYMGSAIPFKVVDRDINDITVTLRAGTKVTGRVLVDGRPPSASEPRVLVQLTGNTPLLGLGAVPVQPDGTFAFENVQPRDYRFRIVQAGRTPWIRAARYGVEDVLTTPIHIEGDAQGRELEIVLSPNTAMLDALVVDNNQRPVPGALVIAVPDYARRNRSDLYRTGNADPTGRVHIEGISPGEYRLFATQEIDAPEWQNPDVIGLHEGRGTVVHFLESGKENVTLRLMP